MFTCKVSDIAAIALHGEMEQERRTSILSGFLNGRYDIVVATGVLARGLDLKNVRQVLVLKFNFYFEFNFNFKLIRYLILIYRPQLMNLYIK